MCMVYSRYIYRIYTYWSLPRYKIADFRLIWCMGEQSKYWWFFFIKWSCSTGRPRLAFCRQIILGAAGSCVFSGNRCCLKKKRKDKKGELLSAGCRRCRLIYHRGNQVMTTCCCCYRSILFYMSGIVFPGYIVKIIPLKNANKKLLHDTEAMED